MAFDPNVLRGLSPEDAEAYIRKNYTLMMPTAEYDGFGEAATSRLVMPEGWQGGGIPSGVEEGELYGVDAADLNNYKRVLFDSPDPDRAYVAYFGPDNQLHNLSQQLGSDWYDKEIAGIPIGAFLPVAAAFGGAALANAGIGSGAAGAGISPGTMAGLETGLAGGAGAGGAGISAGTMAGLEAGLPALEGAGISSGTMAGLEAGLPALEGGASAGAGAGAGISEGTMAGLEAGLAEAGGAVGPSSGLTELAKSLGVNNVYDALKLGLLGAGALDLLGGNKGSGGTGGGVTNLITPYTLNREVNPQAQPLTSKDAYAYLQGKASPTTGKAVSTGQQNWFNDKFTAQDTVNPTTGERFVRDPASGQMIPLKNIQDAQAQVDANKTDTATGADGGIVMLARGGYADLLDGSTLGGYSDGGRLLRGPGDGVSDSIPATIGGKQPARLADGEFVVPARIVSELGNGSTEAGARKLYAMMDRIQRGRRKTVGKNAVAKDSKADKHLPA